MRIGRTFDAAYRKYRGEAASMIISALVGAAVSKAFETYALAATAIDYFLIFGVSSTFAYVVFWSVMIKRRLTWKVANLEIWFARAYGSKMRTQYAERSNHFIAEKSALCTDFARKQLPRLIEHAREQHRLLKKIAVVIDSGTTLEGVFPQLKVRGFGSASEGLAIKIFTNSLSGVEAFNSEVEYGPYPIDHRQLQLLGGTPIEKYRATVGQIAEQSLVAIAEEYRGEDAMIIAVTTANWILPFHQRDALALCAKGEGHHDFKQKLVEIADVVMVVSPLGKMLRFSSVDELNSAIGADQEQYKETIVEKDKASQVLVLTSRRKRGALLHYHAERLRHAPGDWGLRYKLLPDGPTIDEGLPREQEVQVEIPHAYLQADQENAFILSQEADTAMMNARLALRAQRESGRVRRADHAGPTSSQEQDLERNVDEARARKR